jgi:hypothetical protein
MKIWVETCTVERPEFTVSGRFGASIMFVSYSRLTDQWYWLQPNSVIEKIAEPPLIYVEQDYVDKHTLAMPRAELESTNIHLGKSAKQLSLSL